MRQEHNSTNNKLNSNQQSVYKSLSRESRFNNWKRISSSRKNSSSSSTRNFKKRGFSNKPRRLRRKDQEED